MITDRTLQDVELAKTLRLKLQSNQTLTTAEKAQIERGSCTISMLNRIEDKAHELSEILNSYNYFNTLSEKKTWTHEDIFRKNDLDTMLKKLETLEKAYYTFNDTPTIPKYIYEYKKANDVEQILVDIEQMLSDMIMNFPQCGAYECGED